MIKKEQLLKALLTCTFIPLLLKSFDLRSYGSESTKKYTIKVAFGASVGEGFGICSIWRMICLEEIFAKGTGE